MPLSKAKCQRLLFFLGEAVESGTTSRMRYECCFAARWAPSLSAKVTAGSVEAERPSADDAHIGRSAAAPLAIMPALFQSTSPCRKLAEHHISASEPRRLHALTDAI
jgi:hypothetical protein